MGKSIYEQVQEIKQQEVSMLKDVLREHGTPIDGGYEAHFEGMKPVIAGYLFEEPTDIVISAVRVDANGVLILIGYDNNSHEECDCITPDDIFAGHLDYVTEAVCRM